MKKTLCSKTLLSVLILFMVVLFINGQAFAQVTGKDVVNEVLKYEGQRVVYDSAASIQYLYSKVGIKLPGTLDALSRQGTLVKKGEKLELGDIVFFGTSSTRLTSAGIFIGNNQFIISYPPFKTIRVMSLSSTDSKRYYLGARRIINAGGQNPQSSIREKVIQEGLKYVGTPYQFDSNRSSTATFDCSDFVRRTYYDATGKWIPGNSRTQAAYVQEYGKVTTNWSNLQRGDLMFFITPETGRISHVAIYMGGGQILHATSSRGVHVGNMTNYWINRFHFGGNILD